MHEKNEYVIVDYVKLIMALLVIILHTNPLLDYSVAAEWVSRSCITIIAVPFFFVATGFFNGNSLEKVKRSASHLLLLYCIWSVIYLPYSILRLNNEGIRAVLEYAWSFVAYGSFDTIWYLLASAIGLLLAFKSYDRFGRRNSFIIALIFYVIALLGTSYAGIVEDTSVWNIYNLYYKVFSTFKNGLFFGFIFELVGIIISRNEKIIGCKRWLGLTVGSFVLLTAESVLLKLFDLNTHGTDMKLLLIPFSYCLFSLLVELDQNSRVGGVLRKYALLARELSTMMFLSQRIFLEGYDLMGIRNLCSSFTWFLLILFSTLCFSAIVIVASKKIKILRKIY